MTMSFTAHAVPHNQIPYYEAGLSQAFQAPVKIRYIRPPFNPIIRYINLIDNANTLRIRFFIDNQHTVNCILTTYEGQNKIRLEKCVSPTAIILDQLIYL